MQIKTFGNRVDFISEDIDFWLRQHPNVDVMDCDVTMGDLPSLVQAEGQMYEPAGRPFVVVVIYYEEGSDALAEP